MNDLSIIAINIDGVSDKLDNIECINFLSTYDIVFLFEAKCTQRVSMSGFESIRSSLIAGEDLRGGTVLVTTPPYRTRIMYYLLAHLLLTSGSLIQN